MTLRIYIGTADEITARLAGAPSATQTTVVGVTSLSVFTVASATSFNAGDSIVVGSEKGVIASVVSTTITLEEALEALPGIGASVRHYDADYTKYRDQGQPFTFVDDRLTGGGTGENIGYDLQFNDYDGEMPKIVAQNRITIFESEDSATPLFAGVVWNVERIQFSKLGNTPVYNWLVEAKGYQSEADGVGIEEQPFTNVNAGDFLEFLRSKWTNLAAGTIDLNNSPTIDFIRLAGQRRFSEVGRDLSALWPGSEFFIKNQHTGGEIFFRKQVQSDAPITLNQALVERIGNTGEQWVKIRKDYERVFNLVVFPYYRDQLREPDFHVQSTTGDTAFLKTSVTLSGQPTNLEESQLLFDDFSDGNLSEDFVEDDLSNASPPTGFNSSDGYMVEGDVNQVVGLHLLDTSATTVSFGDIGRITDPAVTEPFTGSERQMVYLQELVVNDLGDGLVLGVIDNTSRVTTTTASSTTTVINVTSTTGFVAGDRIDVGGQKAYIQSVGGSSLTLESALSSAPLAGVTVTLHRLAKSRFKFGVLFKATGDLKYIKDGVEQAFSPGRTYSATPSTYSLRLFMQSFETTIASGVSSTGCTLSNAADFATGDVVELFTSGSRSAPEVRTITKSGSTISYAATEKVPTIGYRVRTKPKMVLQIKGGSEYGAITGRTWTTLYTATNTWQTTVNDPDDHGVIVAINQTLVATLSLLQMKDPVPITANIGTRYLHIGTQEVDSAEPDVDCIVRKVGNHHQLDFFPDTKSLWSSGSTLELRYKERWRLHLEAKDTDSMRDMAKIRGYTVSASATEQELVRKGGRALDTISILPTPLTNEEALSQSQAILDAVSTPSYTVEIVTNTYAHTLCKAGQILKSTLPGIPDLTIQRVEIQELPNVQGEDGRTLYRQRILAGTVDRLSEILQRRVLSAEKRLILDDGVTDDSYTRLQQHGFRDSAEALDTFSVSECASPTTVVYDGLSYVALRCLKIA